MQAETPLFSDLVHLFAKWPVVSGIHTAGVWTGQIIKVFLILKKNEGNGEEGPSIMLANESIYFIFGLCCVEKKACSVTKKCASDYSFEIHTFEPQNIIYKRKNSNYLQRKTRIKLWHSFCYAKIV